MWSSLSKVSALSLYRGSNGLPTSPQDLQDLISHHALEMNLSRSPESTYEALQRRGARVIGAFEPTQQPMQWPSLTRAAMPERYRGSAPLALSDDCVNDIVKDADSYEETDPDLLKRARKAVQVSDSIIKPFEGDPYIWKDGPSGRVKKYTNTNEVKVCRILKEVALENVVRVYEVGDDVGGEYVIEEKLTPCELQDVNQDYSRFESCVQAGLQQLHEKCIIHMDLKAQNVGFISESDGNRVFKLFDFNVSGISTPDYKSWKVEPLDVCKKQIIERKEPKVVADKRLYDTYCLTNFDMLHSSDFWYDD